MHRWPESNSDANWALGGRRPIETQGLYVYRNDRLLQAGGWNELTTPSRDLVHARVAVDLDEALSTHVTINPEKTGVVLDAVLSGAWHGGRTASGSTFADYLDTARAGAQETRRRLPRPIEVVEPGRGWTAAMLEAFEDNATFISDEEPIDLRWRGLIGDDVFLIDRADRTIWLNTRYRKALGGSAGLANTDAPVVKALLHLLLGTHLTGSYSGAREKRLEQAWQAILLAAVKEQQDDIDRCDPPGREDDSSEEQ